MWRARFWTPVILALACSDGERARFTGADGSSAGAPGSGGTTAGAGGAAPSGGTAGIGAGGGVAGSASGAPGSGGVPASDASVDGAISTGGRAGPDGAVASGGAGGPDGALGSGGTAAGGAVTASGGAPGSGGATSGGAPGAGGAGSGGTPSSGGAGNGGAPGTGGRGGGGAPGSGGSGSGGTPGSGGTGSGGTGAVDASVDGSPPDGGAPDASPSWGLESRGSNTGCVAPARPVPSGVGLARVFPNLSFSQPVAMVQIPGDGAAWYIAQRTGIVRRFANQQTANSSTVALDITTRVNSDPGEAGLLGVAFDPRFAETGAVYVSYTTYGGPIDLRSRLSRFLSTDGGVTIDPSSEEILLELDQPYSNHNGGDVAFSVDGYLFYSLGDGGSGGDPQNRAQNPNVLFGKILRLDVSAGAGPYAIPADNPYAGGGGRAEIFALGLRNPWRISVDRSTGSLWVGDVGQDAWEEIDIVTLGGNYGWRFREGAHCFNPSTNCPTAGLIDPVAEYRNVGSDACVIGGHVYRGTRLPNLAGTYFFGDCGSGTVRSYTGGGQVQVVGSPGGGISGFAQGVDGEVYVIRYSGTIYGFTDSGGGSSTLPPTLSATGCTDPSDPRILAPGVVPYDLNSPLWSDGAAKERWLAIPDGTTIGIGSDGDSDLPVGTVLGKTFSLSGQRIETRLFVRHADGDWAGYAYEWDAGETEATLLGGSVTKNVSGQDWTIPSRTDCLFCHSVPAGRSLGLETGQLNRDFTYPNGVTGNQLENLEHAGYFSALLPAPVVSLDRFPVPGGGGPVGPRARAYLHANCSMCHRPGAPGLGNMDLRWATPLASTGTCDVPPTNGDFGVAGARFVLPGDPASSVVSLRMHTLATGRMPPLASSVVDSTGTAVIDQWIQGLAACP